jgi:hypothetical protein
MIDFCRDPSLTSACYRLNAVTATNATDFVRFHRSMVVAMANDDLGGLEAYKIEQQTEDEQQGDKATEE